MMKWQLVRAGLIKQGKLKTGGNLVDVGGGIGDLGHAVRDLYDETWTVDISQKNLEAAASKGNFVLNLDIDQQGLSPVTDSSVSMLTALDFIEHIVDPGNFARECFRVLESGGQVFINTPNIRFWKHILELWVDGSFPHTSGDREVYHGGHLAFFTFSDLCDIFGAAGFKAFEQVKDEEGYSEPPPWAVKPFDVKSQQQHIQLMMELGCPNLLFKCEKP
ncbi:MAG: class I SAM-dependent methyltransferase [Candidatus Thorarchaeota archaeon]|jgi:predicted SAM-dependent methyltransferase